MKKPSLHFSPFFIIVIELIPLVICWRPREFPKIGVSRWIQVESEFRGLWQSGDMMEGALKIIDNGNTFVVSPTLLALSIDCNASYPVQWIFHNSQDAATDIYSIRIRSFRWADDVFNPITNKFSSKLELYGDRNKITGNYSCISTEYPSISKNIYVYWEGSSPPYLIHSGANLNVQSEDSKTLVLPCKVSSPNVKVHLFRSKDGEYHSQPINSPYIKFDPKIGFIIKLDQMNNPYGQYKCSTDEDEEPVYIKAVKGLKKKFKFQNYIIGNASFDYNVTEQGIICCSNSSKPPMIHGLYCFDPISCEMKMFVLQKVGNNGIRYKNSSCAIEKVYPRDSGIIRCKGDGIDIFKRFYTSVSLSTPQGEEENKTLQVYFDWKSIDPKEMIKLTLVSGTTLYEKQNITVNCDTSFYYFGEGLKWAIRWNNGSLTFLKKGEDLSSEMSLVAGFPSIRFALHSNMTEILCFAPVWNSTVWVNETYKLEVLRSYPPVIKSFGNLGDSKKIHEIYLTLNATEQTIECNVSGTPLPRIKWMKNNRTILKESNMMVNRENGSAILLIHRVSHETQGEYICKAKNLAGITSKTIHVFVEVPNSNGVVITTVVLFGLTSVAILAFFIWKLNWQKNIISHLTGIAFRDVNNATNSSTVDITSNSNAIAVSSQ